MSNSWMNHSCGNNSPWPSCLSLGTAFITIAFMLLVMLVIVLGNLLVVLTVNNDQKLRSQRQNWLIVSLAIADLLVGLVVMPLTMTYEIIGIWILGDILCELWLALDVLFVTASILHICTISLDRYWSVTQPLTYPNRRTPRRMSIMIGVAWSVSLLICMPPILGWRQPRKNGECSVSNELGYVLYSSLGSFYIPVILLMIIYWKIYSITKHHSRQRLRETERTNKTLCQFSATSKNSLSIKTIKDNQNNDKYNSFTNAQMTLTETTLADQTITNNINQIEKNEEIKPIINKTETQISDNTICLNKNQKSCSDSKKCRIKIFEFNALCFKRIKWISSSEQINEKLEIKKATEKRKKLLKAKERQATMLLGLILTAFIASWLPFFVLYVLGAFEIHTSPVVFKFFFWLGYCNSGINPVIYTVFNREFKRALCRQLQRQQRFLLSVWQHVL